MISRKELLDGEIVYSFDNNVTVRARVNNGLIKFATYINDKYSRNTFVISKDILVAMFIEAKSIIDGGEGDSNKK